MMQKAILVTGGAGYIGSHVVALLIEHGYAVTIVDNLSTGYRRLVDPRATLIVGDCGKAALMREVLGEQQITAVIHLASSIKVSESVDSPLAYYQNNLGASLGLLQAVAQEGISKFLFSSSAAIYGDTQGKPVGEDASPAPINPYGWSKWMVEQVLTDIARSVQGCKSDSSVYRLTYISLRYFNVAGAHRRYPLGEISDNPSHLIKIAAEAACGVRDGLTIHGSDYSTPDGSCIRDYIDVEDLAKAHLLALEYLLRHDTSLVLNCGYGKGFSVREVVATMQRICGRQFPVFEGERREGDPAVLVADSRRIRRLLDWQPDYDDLEKICAAAYQWEQTLR